MQLTPKILVFVFSYVLLFGCYNRVKSESYECNDKFYINEDMYSWCLTEKWWPLTFQFNLLPKNKRDCCFLLERHLNWDKSTRLLCKVTEPGFGEHSKTLLEKRKEECKSFGSLDIDSCKSLETNSVPELDFLKCSQYMLIKTKEKP